MKKKNEADGTDPTASEWSGGSTGLTDALIFIRNSTLASVLIGTALLIANLLNLLIVSLLPYEYFIIGINVVHPQTLLLTIDLWLFQWIIVFGIASALAHCVIHCR